MKCMDGCLTKRGNTLMHLRSCHWSHQGVIKWCYSPLWVLQQAGTGLPWTCRTASPFPMVLDTYCCACAAANATPLRSAVMLCVYLGILTLCSPVLCMGIANTTRADWLLLGHLPMLLPWWCGRALVLCQALWGCCREGIGSRLCSTGVGLVLPPLQGLEWHCKTNPKQTC